MKPTPKGSEEGLKEIVALCKRRGFVFPGSDIYGGLSNTFDYGPYGVELLRNLKNEWWRAFVNDREDVVGLDSSIMLHPSVWVASGHAGSFNDPLTDCRQCKARIRADQYIQEHLGIESQALDLKQIEEIFEQRREQLQCPKCGAKNSLTAPRQFNLMFSTQMGSVSGADQQIYLRPETAQGIFINFRNILDSCRVQIPFGVAQIGKSFRNEIVARQFIFRTREFEQLELEYFCAPGSQKSWFDHWVDFCMNWLYSLGLRRENLRLRNHGPEELSFYSENTVDIEYRFPFGWGELWGIASRTNYDLKQHTEHSRKNLEYRDQEGGKSYIPYVIEPALGLNRLLLAILCDAYHVEKKGTREQRTLLKLHPRLAPVKAGIFPLQRKDGLPELAKEIYQQIAPLFPVDLDLTGSIGKRYYRQDELGTPLGITIDYETKEDHSVTLRDRDSASQVRMPIDKLTTHLTQALSNPSR